MREMFLAGNRGGIRRGARKLVSPLPFTVYILDVGCSVIEAEKEEVYPEEVESVPFRALWRGLTDPAVDWGDRHHFDWKTFDSIALAGGLARREQGELASYAVVDRDYLNFNLRFGYHFTIVDTFCGGSGDENYIQLRFAGGGGNFRGRALRILFVRTLLAEAGFATTTTGDLLDARLLRVDAATVEERLVLLGRLLGATKVLDMVLTEESMVHRFLAEFRAGGARFGSRDEEKTGE